MGHIRSDAIENIWTNLAKGQHLHNLKKITPVDELHGVKIARPLLDVDKSDIFNFARSFGIPWLHNSTPEWSNRGKLRDSFSNAIVQQFGESANDNIEYAANVYSHYGKIVREFVVDRILLNTIGNNYGCKFVIPITHIDLLNESILQMLFTDVLYGGVGNTADGFNNRKVPLPSLHAFKDLSKYRYHYYLQRRFNNLTI